MTSGPDIVTTGLLRRWPLPQFADDVDKNERGQVLVIAGSRPVPGAALLAGVAALRAGAGKLQLAVPESVACALAVAVPEALVAGLPETEKGGIDPRCIDQVVEMAGDAAAIVIGPGMVDPPAVGSLTEGIASQLPPDNSIIVIDAAAITTLDATGPVFGQRHARVIVTPNPGEFKALAGDQGERPDGDGHATVRMIAERLCAVVAVRGVVASPVGRLWLHEGGGVGLATSGSGDVLAGLIVGLAARGAEPAQAAVWGVHAHGRAGERLATRFGAVGYLARELLDEIPRALVEIGA